MPLSLGLKPTFPLNILSIDLNSNQSEENNMTTQENNQPAKMGGPPPLPLNLHEHKRSIFLNWGGILLTSCIAPLVLFPSLHWGANLSLKICLFPNFSCLSHELTIRCRKFSPECSQRHSRSIDLIFARLANMATTQSDLGLPTPYISKSLECMPSLSFLAP